MHYTADECLSRLVRSYIRTAGNRGGYRYVADRLLEDGIDLYGILLKKYRHESKPAKQVGKEIGVSGVTVYAWLRAANIPVRTREERKWKYWLARYDAEKKARDVKPIVSRLDIPPGRFRKRRRLRQRGSPDLPPFLPSFLPSPS